MSLNVLHIRMLSNPSVPLIINKSLVLPVLEKYPKTDRPQIDKPNKKYLTAFIMGEGNIVLISLICSMMTITTLFQLKLNIDRDRY